MHGDAESSGGELIEAEEIPNGGKKFDPPRPLEAVPDGMWLCDMGTTHWVQHRKGDGECPVCGMFLKQKTAGQKAAEKSAEGK